MACHHSSVVNSVSLVRLVTSSCSLSDQESTPSIPSASWTQQHPHSKARFFLSEGPSARWLDWLPGLVRFPIVRKSTLTETAGLAVAAYWLLPGGMKEMSVSNQDPKWPKARVAKTKGWIESDSGKGELKMEKHSPGGVADLGVNVNTRFSDSFPAISYLSERERRAIRDFTCSTGKGARVLEERNSLP